MVNRIGWSCLALVLALAGAACGGDDGRGVDPGSDAGPGVDAGPPDSGAPAEDSGVEEDSGAGEDAGTPDDAGVGGDAGARSPVSGVVQTSGGAVVMSSEYRLRIAVGAPQPMGSASDSEHTLGVGPVPE